MSVSGKTAPEQPIRWYKNLSAGDYAGLGILIFLFVLSVWAFIIYNYTLTGKIEETGVFLSLLVFFLLLLYIIYMFIIRIRRIGLSSDGIHVEYPYKKKIIPWNAVRSFEEFYGMGYKGVPKCTAFLYLDNGSRIGLSGIRNVILEKIREKLHSGGIEEHIKEKISETERSEIEELKERIFKLPYILVGLMVGIGTIWRFLNLPGILLVPVFLIILFSTMIPYIKYSIRANKLLRGKVTTRTSSVSPVSVKEEVSTEFIKIKPTLVKCYACSEVMEIVSSKRPLVVECKKCGAKGLLK